MAPRLAGAWKLSVAALCLFVIDGFVSNYMLFGEPRLSHPAMNIVISTTALFFLSLGRSELRRKQ
ncbi:MAG: hypothetical protein VB878_10870 [Pirellulaceae bacterium]